jgi:WD40 repeat protein
MFSDRQSDEQGWQVDASVIPREKRTLSGHKDSVWVLALLPNGDLASGSIDNTIKIWSVSSGRCLMTLSRHRGWVRALAVLQDGMLASG